MATATCPRCGREDAETYEGTLSPHKVGTLSCHSCGRLPLPEAIAVEAEPAPEPEAEPEGPLTEGPEGEPAASVPEETQPPPADRYLGIKNKVLVLNEILKKKNLKAENLPSKEPVGM